MGFAVRGCRGGQEDGSVAAPCRLPTSNPCLLQLPLPLLARLLIRIAAKFRWRSIREEPPAFLILCVFRAQRRLNPSWAEADPSAPWHPQLGRLRLTFLPLLNDGTSDGEGRPARPGAYFWGSGVLCALCVERANRCLDRPLSDARQPRPVSAVASRSACSASAEPCVLLANLRDSIMQGWKDDAGSSLNETGLAQAFILARSYGDEVDSWREVFTSDLSRAAVVRSNPRHG